MEVMNMKPRYKYMAIDQYGDKVLIEKHPRKELLEHTGYSSASKMYIDDKDGNTFHTGYVVGPQWFDVWGIEGETFIKQE
jgi:hypothetical protein